VLPSRIEQFSPGMRMITVDVRGKRDGREKVLLRQHVPVKIFRKVRVAVATRDLAVGERMRKGDWRVEEREIDYAPERYAMGDLTGRRVMSKLRAGTALTASVIQVMPAVRRGQPVELVYQTPGLVIKCRSVAGRDGKVGDIIPVTTVFPSGKGKRELRARIVDDGRAVLVGPLASGKPRGLASRE
jgi:flagella basal body P-ring formation protein FlgA